MSSYPPRPATSAAAGLGPEADRVRGRVMAASLGRLLDRVRGAREVLPHLAALEAGLMQEGLAALKGLPRNALARICSQLGSLPLPEDDPPLHDLLTRLMDQLEARPLERDNQPFDIERTVVIEEVTHSAFMAAERADAPTEIDDGRFLHDLPMPRPRGEPEPR